MEFHATTILAVRRNGAVAIGGDGQVSLGNTIVKADATKIRRLAEGSVLVGFAGSAADSFALMERFEARLKDHPANLPRAATARRSHYTPSTSENSREDWFTTIISLTLTQE